MNIEQLTTTSMTGMSCMNCEKFAIFLLCSWVHKVQKQKPILTDSAAELLPAVILIGQPKGHFELIDFFFIAFDYFSANLPKDCRYVDQDRQWEIRMLAILSLCKFQGFKEI